jgi:[ribosomal protein S5]-alanine N-acetyltransferase
MHLRLDEHLTLRRFTAADATSLAHHANDRTVWRNLRDGFPHPYTLADAEAFVGRAGSEPDAHVFCIDVDGQAVGATGVHPLSDVYRHSAEVGYWLGQPYRGQGIATRVLAEVTRFAFGALKLRRLQAGVFAWNPASARVLEKNGYTLEAVQRQAVFKDGQLIDALLYVALAPR